MTDIFLRKQEIRPGKTDRLRELIDEFASEAEADEAGVREIWAEETLHTISLFVEHGADAAYLVWYIEAESMAQLVAAREASTHPLHEVEDAIMAEVLVDPGETGDVEPLVHGTSPARSDAFSIQTYQSESP